jgi:hypothetical protein
MLAGYLIEDIATSGATIRTLRAGSGPPLLLLHGYPQTHVIWHKTAGRLAKGSVLLLHSSPKVRVSRFERGSIWQGNLNTEGKGRGPLIPVSESVFFLGTARIEFVKDAQGAVTHFTRTWVEGDLKYMRKPDRK